MIKKDSLSPEQEFAAEPTRNVWVQANAGTGKTSVLVERLLRILFRDDTGGAILCLTYTNAAAGEMKNRILKSLRQWALSDDETLTDLLRGVAIHQNPTADDLAHARKVFFYYIDNPDILKIKTIHGFCEEILRRFPVEAGLPPSWTLVSDAPQRVLLHDALARLVNSTQNDLRTARAFDYLVGVVSEYNLDKLLVQIEQQYKYFFNVENFDNYRAYFIDTIKEKLNIQKEINVDIPRDRLQNIVNLAKSEKKAGKTLINLINLTEQYIEKTIDFEKYKTAYLTSAGAIIQRGLNYAFLDQEKQRVFDLNNHLINEKLYADSVAFFDLASAFAKNYQSIKRERNVLDFEDLILYTHRLFSNPKNMGWVLSQLDLSLSHILVDEAQDTSPAQWDILRMLVGDFFVDADCSNAPRSLFVVGDTKQSIYGFQGADPRAFATSRQEIAMYIKNNVRDIQEVPLTQSFRSTKPILDVVDAFFNDTRVAQMTGFVNNSHKCFRVDAPGLVELHKLVSGKEDDAGTNVWCRQYLSNIADKIENLISSHKYEPRDIMILVRQRTPLVVPMTNELKRRGIAVAGSDRIVLPEYPVIRDLMNLLRFCMNTDDDYALGCVLKSPMFRLNEQSVYNLCVVRNTNKTGLFAALQDMYPDVYSVLTDFIGKSCTSGPYTFFTCVLNSCGMRAKMLAALGDQILDPLEEFITICLVYERTRPGTLRHFLKWFITGNAEIKRNMDSGDGVRIVTVHGSKGLQSPVVFLIDTVSMPKSENIYDITNGDKPVWLWVAHTPKEQSPEYIAIKNAATRISTEENFRLLYVAMTRARDELYIYGFSRNTDAPDLSWHKMLWDTLSTKPDMTVSNDVIRVSNYDN